jgi:hypothetical protein
MDTEVIKDYIHKLQIEQLIALGEFRDQNTASLRDFREEWVKGHIEVTTQLVAVKEQVARQNGNVAALQKWKSDHPIVCEVKPVISLLTNEINALKQKVSDQNLDDEKKISGLKQQISNRIVSDRQKEKDDLKWEMRIRPVVKIIGILALGALGSHVTDLGKLLKLW